ncbi:MAG: putative porin [Deltaproteobacteria bacterium]|nr:putative porin [Deltaproteobacteria bacterium]
MIKRFFVLLMALMFGFSSLPAYAGVEVGDNLSLFGDVRYRYEQDDRDHTTKEERDRHRIRARIGAKYTVDENWGLKIRLATKAGSANSPHQTLGDGGSDSFGLDQAYISYKVADFNAIFGKAAAKYWATTEVVFDGDLQHEGIQLGYKAGPVGFHAGYFIATEAGWTPDNPNDDEIYTTAQVVYGQGFGGLKLKAALGAVSIANEGDALQAESHSTASAQLKGGIWRVAVDYIQSDADEEETAIVAQARIKATDWLGFRIYSYSVGAFAAPYDGMASQDNFPNPGGSGVSNFDGIRVQADFKLASKVSLDIRYYDMEPKEKVTDNADGTYTIAGLTTKGATYVEEDAILTDDRTRIQVNLNVKF